MSVISRNSRRACAEFAVGSLTILGLAALMVCAVTSSGRQSNDGYQLSATFTGIDGLETGSDVRLAGVTVGHVVDESIDPKTYRAKVAFVLREDIKLPEDTAAIITSDSLLGGKYIALSPGGSETLLQEGGVISQTQGSMSLERLLSKFIFSVTDTLSRVQSGGGNKPAASSEGRL